MDSTHKIAVPLPEGDEHRGRRSSPRRAAAFATTPDGRREARVTWSLTPTRGRQCEPLGVALDNTSGEPDGAAFINQLLSVEGWAGVLGGGE